MIVILGASCSGKSTIEKILTDHGYNRIISYTSRPIRKNEKEHVDYHFITEEEFSKRLTEGFFAEDTIYNSWHYGIAKDDCVDNAIAVVETKGYHQLLKNKNLKIISFLIETEERERVIRMMKRGDNVLESFRRIVSDQGQFSGIEREVDYTISNPDGDPNNAAQKILDILHIETEVT